MMGIGEVIKYINTENKGYKLKATRSEVISKIFMFALYLNRLYKQQMTSSCNLRNQRTEIFVSLKTHLNLLNKHYRESTVRDAE